MRIMLIITAIFLAVNPDLSAFDGDSWIISGDNVRARRDASVSSPVVAELKAGTVVRVLSKTDKRDKFLQGDSFGYYWYQAALPGNKKGWVYGKYIYQMNGERFGINPELFSTAYKINNKNYYFGIAVEEAYPVSDDTGLTGSVINAIPFFLEDGKGNAMLFRTLSVRTYHYETNKFPYYFRLDDSEGGIQKIESLVIGRDARGVTVKLNIDFNTQIGGGNFYIIARPDKGHLIITEYKMVKEVK